jgi:hypothetical protein
MGFADTDIASINASAARQILFIPMLRSLPERVHPSPLLWGKVLQ